MNYFIYFLLIGSLVYWLEFFPGLIPNLLIKRKDSGHELELWLKAFNWNSRAPKSDLVLLPYYKFYTEIIDILLELSRKLGGSYQEATLFLREGLQLDRQFEKKIKEATLGVWFQILFMMILTWIFILGASSLVDVKLKPLSLLMIFFWQCLGLVCLPMTLGWLRRIYFAEIGTLWKMLFVLKSLSKVPLPRSEILSIAHIQGLTKIKQKALLPLAQKLAETCQSALKLGTSYEQEVKYLMEELRFLEKWHFELFEKKLTVLKLALLSVFFLPSYLAFIFLLLGDLMSLM